MPLNPNGKVDKPALPFPDTAQLAAASRQTRQDMVADNANLTPTQQLVREIWLTVLPHAPQDLGLTDNFFDVGGHSILATRVVFEIRQRFAVDISLGILFRQPTISGLSREIDVLRGGNLDMNSRPPSSDSTIASSNYLSDALDLVKSLPERYPTLDDIADLNHGTTIFLTGATGFLGAFLMRDLFGRRTSNIRVIAHVRANSIEMGLERIKNSCEAYGTWSDSWLPRLEVVTGSLENPRLGMNSQKWDELSQRVDVIIHNGAMVRGMICKI
jgi:L-2-aminoadipate reductase